MRTGARAYLNLIGERPTNSTASFQRDALRLTKCKLKRVRIGHYVRVPLSNRESYRGHAVAEALAICGRAKTWLLPWARPEPKVGMKAAQMQ
jgi:hypothetical protein